MSEMDNGHKRTFHLPHLTSKNQWSNMGQIGVLVAHFQANPPILNKYTLPSIPYSGVLSKPNQLRDYG